ncbi:endonuclease domain-containing protein [soil metagenome]
MRKPKAYVARARELRKDMSLPERLVWAALRGSQLDGLRFRRQHPMGPYVFDFFCVSAQLAVEIDSDAHEMGDQPGKDSVRDAWMAERGVRTLRIPARWVLDDVDSAVAAIRSDLAEHSPHRPFGPPPPQGEDSGKHRPPPVGKVLAKPMVGQVF